MTRAAVEELGGMSKFVSSGDKVVIKPNIAWMRPPTAAATTNPEVVAELVRMCKEAGAGKIIVVDNIIDRPVEGVLNMTGIKAAAELAGAQVLTAENESDYALLEIKDGIEIKKDTCMKLIQSADVFINVPIAKVHSATTLTLSMKNLMGCNCDPNSWHDRDLDQCIADYSTAIKPTLIVMDANRILLTNGPKGPGDTKDTKQVIAGTNAVAVDSYATTLFGMQTKDISYITKAAAIGIGPMDLSKLSITNVSI